MFVLNAPAVFGKQDQTCLPLCAVELVHVYAAVHLLLITARILSTMWPFSSTASLYHLKNWNSCSPVSNNGEKLVYNKAEEN